MLKHILPFRLFEFEDEEAQIESIVKSYLRDSIYDLANSLGNCAFFSKDFYDWAKANGMSPALIYLQHENQKGKEVEDHIIPVLNGYAVDFAYTPKGVSRKTRVGNPVAIEYQLDPEYTKLEDVKEKYSKFGYPDYFVMDYDEAFAGGSPKISTIEEPEKN